MSSEKCGVNLGAGLQPLPRFPIFSIPRRGLFYPKSFSLNSTYVLVSFFGLFALCHPKLCFDSVPVNALSQQTLPKL